MIDQAVGGNVRTWIQTRGNERRIALAPADFSYVVILADRGTHIMLWTAFFVEHSHRREKLRKEYEAYVRGMSGQPEPKR